jgi:hypothetical protein
LITKEVNTMEEKKLMLSLIIILTPIFIFGHILMPQNFTYSLYTLLLAFGFSARLLFLVWNHPIETSQVKTQ